MAGCILKVFYGEFTRKVPESLLEESEMKFVENNCLRVSNGFSAASRIHFKEIEENSDFRYHDGQRSCIYR